MFQVTNIFILSVVLCFLNFNVYAGWFSVKPKKSFSYNVMLYTPSGEEIFLNNVDDISNCQRVAAEEANKRSVPMNYACCKTDGKNFCISKHK